MLRTIKVGTCVLVQGIFAGHLPNGRIRVRVGDRLFSGWPANKTA